mmetsp:Transcript_812/g.1777  ORF Transcript_812/g.1777 Transcript_812/m.1777 type:complete len:408 (+) Transcript_812:92-1315(+)
MLMSSQRLLGSTLRSQKVFAAATVRHAATFAQSSSVTKLNGGQRDFGPQIFALAAAGIGSLLVGSLPSSHARCEEADLFPDDSLDDIAEQVASFIPLPYVPHALKVLLTKRLLIRFSRELNPKLRGRLREVLQSAASDSSLDDASLEEQQALAKEIAAELNMKIDCPLLTEEQEWEVTQRIIYGLLRVAHTSRTDITSAALTKGMAIGSDLLQPDNRAELAKVMNASVDVPFMTEAQEECMFNLALNKCAEGLQTCMPGWVLDSMRHNSKAGLQATKAQLVDKICDMLDMPMLSDDQKKWLAARMVDHVVDSALTGTSAEFLLMTTAEQRQALLGRRQQCIEELELSRRKFERQQAAAEMQLKLIDQKLRALPSERSWLWSTMVWGGSLAAIAGCAGAGAYAYSQLQ